MCSRQFDSALGNYIINLSLLNTKSLARVGNYMMHLIDSIIAYHKDMQEYTAKEAAVEVYNNLPFYKKWFTTEPYSSRMPEFYNKHLYGEYDKIAMELRAWNGKFFIACTVRIDNSHLLGCQMDVMTGTISGLLGSNMPTSKLPKEIRSKMDTYRTQVKSILESL